MIFVPYCRLFGFVFLLWLGGTCGQLVALPATHAYLSVPQLEELVHSSWATELHMYKPLITEVLAAEEIYEPTHHVFYHAQMGSLRIVQDFIKEWYQFLYPHVPVKDFYFLRAWYQLPQTVDANTFIDEVEGGMPIEWCDNHSFFVKRMLSVNFSLFGSTQNFGVFGECTFKYFFMGKSIKKPLIENLLLDIFDHNDFDKKYIETLFKLNAFIETKEGSLYQLFVPKDKVDQIAFVAQRLGTPYRKPVIANYFDFFKQRHRGLTSILEAYCNAPTTIIDVLDRLQGRLLFSQDILLNPTSGVKIFRYTTIPHEKLKIYQYELKKVCKRIFKRWLKRIHKGKISIQIPVTHALVSQLIIHYGL